jgi:RND family efflux transporter MFP subunit
MHSFCVVRPGHLSACAAGLLFLAGCGSPESASQAPAVPKVTVVQVVEEETANVDEYVGRTEAVSTIEVRARVSGELIKADFKEGDVVTAGEPLFEIDPSTYEAIHNQDLAKVRLWETKAQLAKAKLARSEKLVKDKVVTQEEYEEDRAAVEAAKAQIEAAEADAARSKLDLDFTKISSTIDGKIDRKFVAAGNYISGGSASATALTRIVSVHPIYAYFEVDEPSLLKYLSMKKEADDAAGSDKPIRERDIACRMQFGNEKGFPHAGKLDFVETRVDPSTSTIRLRGVFDNQDGLMFPGFFARVQIPVGKPYQALLIPEQAISADLTVKFVYVVGGDNVVARRDVKLGQQRGKRRIVESGLAAGDRVIVGGLQRVRPDQKVEPIVETPAAARSASQPKKD